jgi:hypothetical protein
MSFPLKSIVRLTILVFLIAIVFIDDVITLLVNTVNVETPILELMRAWSLWAERFRQRAHESMMQMLLRHGCTVFSAATQLFGDLVLLACSPNRTSLTHIGRILPILSPLQANACQSPSQAISSISSSLWLVSAIA